MKNIIFIAPPSAGKGTQSEMLVTKYGYKHLSTGDLLRAEIATGSKLGEEIKEVIDKGDLVSDELITRLLKSELSKYVEEEKFILDGYPRNLEQAEILSAIFKELGIKDYVVIYLDIDKETAMKRALGRIVCNSCGASYNIYYEGSKSKIEGICNECNTQLTKRDDDTEETFNKRFDTYLEKTSPVIEYYKNLFRLEKIKVAEKKEETFSAIERILND